MKIFKNVLLMLALSEGRAGFHPNRSFIAELKTQDERGPTASPWLLTWRASWLRWFGRTWTTVTTKPACWCFTIQATESCGSCRTSFRSAWRLATDLTVYPFWGSSGTTMRTQCSRWETMMMMIMMMMMLMMMMMMLMMMMMMRRLSSLRVRAMPRHLLYIYIYIYHTYLLFFFGLPNARFLMSWLDMIVQSCTTHDDPSSWFSVCPLGSAKERAKAKELILSFSVSFQPLMSVKPRTLRETHVVTGWASFVDIVKEYKWELCLMCLLSSKASLGLNVFQRAPWLDIGDTKHRQKVKRRPPRCGAVPGLNNHGSEAPTSQLQTYIYNI